VTGNLSAADRGIRAALGAGLLALGAWRGVGTLDFAILGLLGVAILLTAALGFDPLYRIYGITTRGGLRRLPCDEHGESCRPEFHSHPPPRP
jgi:hypothetical protein